MKDFLVYTDKPTDFEFKVEVEGASLKEARTRLILSGDTTDFILEGKINSEGEAKIEIPKLKGLVLENYKGSMQLEVIVDDAYFQPWNGTYKVTASKKVTVNEIHSKKEPTKSSMVVTVKQKKSLYDNRIEHIVEGLSKKQVTSKNILNKHNKKHLYALLEVTFGKPLTGLDTGPIINDIIHLMGEGS